MQIRYIISNILLPQIHCSKQVDTQVVLQYICGEVCLLFIMYIGMYKPCCNLQDKNKQNMSPIFYNLQRAPSFLGKKASRTSQLYLIKNKRVQQHHSHSNIHIFQYISCKSSFFCGMASFFRLEGKLVRSAVEGLGSRHVLIQLHISSL